MCTCTFLNNARARGKYFRLCLILTACGFVLGLTPEAAHGQTSEPPRIVVQPQSQTVFEGDTVSFYVGATGTPPLGYRWRRNGIPVVGSGQGTDTLTISNVNLSYDSNRFSVIITNSANPFPGIISSNALLRVLPSGGALPFITSHPASQMVPPGTDVTFGVTAIGPGPLSYQWRFNDANIPGAVNGAYTVFNAQLSNSGPYTVVVSNPNGSVTSNPAMLLVNAGVPPVITSHPQSQTVFVGDTVVFHVEATGTPPLGYRWRRNGIPVVGSGQGTDTLIITNVPLSFNSNRFSVVVTNSADPVGVLSSNALLIVLSSSNDPPQIGRQPLSQTVAVGGTAVFSVEAAGSPPLSYQWLFNDSALTGKISRTLVLSNVQPSSAGNYSVRVSNPFGSTTSSNATLTVVESPAESPMITTQPQSQTALPGWDVIFSVHATGTPPLSYRWRRNGVTLSGETNFMLTLNDVTEANAGVYTVVVSNAFGFVLSAPAVLTVETNFGPNIVVNGVFNDLSPAGIPGWVVNGEWFRASDSMGESWIGLASGTDVYQDLPTTPGQPYLLSFDARGFPGSFSGETQLGVYWGDQSLGAVALPNTNWFWARHTFRLLAAGEPTRLRFRNVGPDSFVKPSLDNVSLVALAPEDDPDPGPAEMVQDLILAVDQADLERKTKRPLVTTLKSVAAAFEGGQWTTAVNQLRAFQHKIHAQVGDPVLAEMWSAAAQEIIDALHQP